MNTSKTKIDLRNFWLIWTVIFLAIWLYPLLSKWDIVLWSLSISTAFMMISFIIPTMLKPFYFVWIKFWNVLWWINSRIIMLILFFLIFTPVALVLKLLGKDLLRKKIDKSKGSYWVEREDGGCGSMDYQF